MWLPLLFIFPLVSSIELNAAPSTVRGNEATKENIKIGLVYQNFGRSKKYDKALSKLNDAALVSSLRAFTSKFTLSAVDCHLPKAMFYVQDVLDCICGVMVKEQVAVIVFATATEEFDESSSAAQFFIQTAASTGIPILAWNADNAAFALDKDLSAYRMLQMAPPIEHQIRAMLALLERYNWTRFGVVCAKMGGDEQFVYALLEEIARVKKSIKLEIVFDAIIDASNSTDLEEQLNRLKQSQAKVILLYANHNLAKIILEAGAGVGVVSERHLWIGTQSVKATHTNVPSGLPSGMLAVTFNTVSDPNFSTDEDVIPLVISVVAKLLGTAVMNRQNTSFPLRSVSTCSSSDSISPSWANGLLLYDALKKSFVKGNPSHSKDGQNSFFYTFDQYGKLKNSILTISNLRSKVSAPFYWDTVGTFTNDELRMEDVEWPGGRANPPQMTADKFHLRVVTLHEPPFIVVSDVDSDTKRCPGDQGAICNWGDIPGGNGSITKCCSGYCVDLLNKLANDMGFDYTLYKVRDEKWGIKTETGWNGLPQDLINGNADMCVTALKLNSERAKDIDFSVPFLDTGIAIIVKIRSGVLSPTAFLEPFEYSMWATILFVCIQGAALFIFVFEWVSPYSFNMHKYPPPDHKFSLCRSYWLVWATLFQASVSTDIPRSFAARFMALAWAAFGLTFLALYTANLAAFMITRVQFHDLSGINDSRLLYPEDQKPPFRFGTVEGGNTHETMRKNWRRMHEYIKRQRFFNTNISSGIDAVIREELDAFIYDAVVLDYWAGKEANCQLMTVGKWASMTGYGIGLPKNSHLTPLVNHWMLQYQQNGDLERLQNFWLTGACTPDGHGQTHSVPLGIENFMSAFFLLAAGIIVSVIVLGCEFLYVKHLREPLKKVDPEGNCGLISMALGKSLTLQDAVGRVNEWRKRAESLAPLSPSKKKAEREASLHRRGTSGGRDRLHVESHL